MRKHCKQRNIIIATPSNAAANIYLENFVKIPELEGQFKRLVSYHQAEKDLIPDAISKYCAMISIASENVFENETQEIVAAVS
jgi:hypothetical protein